MPDHNTITEFRKDNGEAIRKVCAQLIAMCRRLELFAEASVAIDGAKFKAVNARHRNFTRAKMTRRLEQIKESVGRYLQQLESADRQEPSLVLVRRHRRFSCEHLGVRFVDVSANFSVPGETMRDKKLLEVAAAVEGALAGIQG